MIPEPSEGDSHDCPLCSDKISRAGLKLLTEPLGYDEMTMAIKGFRMPRQDTPLRRIADATGFPKNNC